VGMMNDKLTNLLTTCEQVISKEHDKMISTAYTIGANSSVAKIHAIFSTLSANVNNPDLDDEKFRSLCGQFLTGLDKLYEDTKKR